MSVSIVAHEEPHLSIRLKYLAGEGETQLALADQVLAAIHALAADWLEPLAWEMDVGCLDTDSMDTPIHPKPPQPYWLLRKEQIPPGVDINPIYDNHTVIREPVLSSERIHVWVDQALAQSCVDAPRFTPYWDSFYTLAMRVRLPASVGDAAHESLGMRCYAGTIAMPLERYGEDVWVSGPPERYLIGPPVKIRASSLYGMVVNLDLAMYWSLWIDDPVGRAQVEAAVDRVLALGRGWRRSEE